MRRERSFGLGGKLAFTVVVALLAGFAWAWIERRGLSFEIPGRSGEPAPPPKVEKKDRPEPDRKNAVTPKDDPARTRKDPTVPDSKPALTEGKLAAIFESVESHVAEARFAEAWALLSEVKEIQVASETMRARLRSTRERVQTYLRLIRETQRGGTIRMPEMTRLNLKSGGRLVARRLQEDASRYHFEDIRGARGSVAKSDVESTTKLDRAGGFVEVWFELQRRASASGIEAKDEKVNEVYVYRFSDRPNRKAAGWQFFDLADFCAANGANELVTPLFDEALRRDPDVATTMHEKKGERMVEILFYFLSIQAVADAEFTLTKVLIPQYSDTRAYRERLLQDEDAKGLIARVLKQEVKLPPPDTRKDEGPPPTRTEEPPVRPTAEPKPEDLPFPAMPGDTPPAVRAKTDEGDRAFREATTHLLKSDPNANPEGWASENKKAYERYKVAAGAYDAAQNLYPDTKDIPKALLERFREAQMRMSLCRKRAVSNR